MKKLNVLITNMDVHGVNFYRSEQPAIALSDYFDDLINVEYTKEVDWNDDTFLKQFDIIHSHRTFTNDYSKMPELVAKLRSFGIITILDIDDYWEVSKEHPMYHMIKMENFDVNIKNNLKLVDYITTTTPVFAEYIKPYNKNVFVIENGINDLLDEFKFSTDKCSKDKLRLMYLAGSSHLQDLNLVKDSFTRLCNDKTLENKFQLHLAGFDLRGNTSNYNINPDLIRVLQARKLTTPEINKKLLAVNYNLDKISEIPDDIKERFRGKSIIKETKDIKPYETVWARYEEIFTNNYNLIKDPEYLKYLKKFDLDTKYPNTEKQDYIRHKTKGLYSFAKNYQFADIAIAPIKTYGDVSKDTPDNRYQFAKSNLKVIEAAFHKVPVIASNVPIYNFDKDWVDGYNILFIDSDRQEKDWYKKIKYCINNPEYVKELGENAYKTAVKKYHVKTLAEKRMNFYNELFQNKELIHAEKNIKPKEETKPNNLLKLLKRK